MNKTKLTKQEKRWILYDVGNSAFTMLVATILPIYFNGLAGAAGLSEVEYLAYWGYAASIATLIAWLLSGAGRIPSTRANCTAASNTEVCSTLLASIYPSANN